MKLLQITLFIIANVVFITQSGRDLHQLIFGAQPSILDQFDPEMTKARSEKNMDVLVDEYRAVNDEILALEKGKGWKEVQDAQREHNDLYLKKNALNAEISEREEKRRELRDIWIFTAFGTTLIILGTLLYRWRAVWPGLSIVIAGFSVFEYWVSPPLFGGAGQEFHAVLVSKTVLIVIALVGLYLVARVVRVSPKETTA
jgi:hypothetical protein